MNLKASQHTLAKKAVHFYYLNTLNCFPLYPFYCILNVLENVPGYFLYLSCIVSLVWQWDRKVLASKQKKGKLLPGMLHKLMIICKEIWQAYNGSWYRIMFKGLLIVFIYDSRWSQGWINAFATLLWWAFAISHQSC